MLLTSLAVALTLGHVDAQDVLARFLQTCVYLAMTHPILMNASCYEAAPLNRPDGEQFANRSRSGRAGILPEALVLSW
jgi:hypothetical protein